MISILARSIFMNKYSFIALLLLILFPFFLFAEKLDDKELLDLISQMTTEEKIGMVHGDTIFATLGVPRLGVPPLVMADGPHGVRWETAENWWQKDHPHNKVTSFPTLTALAATWNQELANEYGKALGKEFYSRGKDVALGPGINILRTPLNGRNFEYMGEDPYLAGKIAANEVLGMQSEGVAVCLKHFALNNHECNRLTISVECEERAVREIYLPAFKRAIKEGDALSLMPAYNKFRGYHCAENPYLLDQVLREDWGYQGVAISDWGATHSTDLAQAMTLDIEMGTAVHLRRPHFYYMAEDYLKGIKAGKYDEANLDRKIYHILYLIKQLGKLGETEARVSSAVAINLPETQATALKTASESIVLLANKEKVLPLPKGELKLLVIGDAAIRKYSNTGGSSNVDPLYEISILEGLQNYAVLNPGIKIDYLKGYSGYQFPTGWLKVKGNLSKYDKILLCLGTNHENNAYGEKESSDRIQYDLPPSQIKLLSRLLKERPDTIVTVTAGTPVGFAGMGDKIQTLLYTWFNGSENGTALAKILFGEITPSGRLPFTIANQLSDYPAHASKEQYPGVNGVITYSEGSDVGYRYFDKHPAKVLFPFGYGLSYSQFEISNMQQSRVNDQIQLTGIVKNIGSVASKTVVQLYVSDLESSLARPLKELKAFTKIELAPNEEKEVVFVLNYDAFAFFDDSKMQWVAEDGEFEFFITQDAKDFTSLTSTINNINNLKRGIH